MKLTRISLVRTTMMRPEELDLGPRPARRYEIVVAFLPAGGFCSTPAVVVLITRPASLYL